MKRNACADCIAAIPSKSQVPGHELRCTEKQQTRIITMPSTLKTKCRFFEPKEA